MHELREMLPDIDDQTLEATVYDPYDGDEIPCIRIHDQLNGEE